MEDIEYQTKNPGHNSSRSKELLEVLKQNNQCKKQGFRKMNQTVYMKDCHALRGRDHWEANIIIQMRGDEGMNNNILPLIFRP